MGLKLKLRPDERLIVNGCIMRNGKRRAELIIENYTDVLRGTEMLDEATANTPVRRLCYNIQIALVSSSHRKTLIPEILAQLDRIEEIMRRTHGEVLKTVRNRIIAQDFYTAYRKLLPVIEQEKILLDIAASRQERKSP